MAQKNINIGRAADNDHCLSADSLVSGHHLRLSQNELGQVFAQDLQSTNGTLINDRRIRDEQVRLKSGDKVVVGKTELTWEAWFEQINNDDLPLASTPQTQDSSENPPVPEPVATPKLKAEEELEAIRAANQREDQSHNRIFKLAFFIFTFMLVALLAFWYFTNVKQP